MISRSAQLLSIIVVNYRSWIALHQLLSLLAVSESSEFEIIVVDNQSGDDQFPRFEHDWPQVNWILSSRNSGFAAGCNLGASQARGRYLLFLNPDIEARPEQIHQLLQISKQNPQFAILACNQVGAKGDYRKVFGGFPHLMSYSRLGSLLIKPFLPKQQNRRAFDGLRDCDWVTGAVVLIPRTVFDRLDGWSEDFWMYSEDLDLCRRAHDVGFRVACTGDVTLVHLHGASSRVDLETEVIARSEVIISKHVYLAKHYRGLARAFGHGQTIASRVVPLSLLSVIDLLCFSRVRRLKIRRKVAGEMLRYYRTRPWTQQWRSPRAQTRDAAS